jgi:hypothetical protein
MTSDIKRKGSYREVRRLAYLRLLCNIISEKRIYQIDDLIKKFLEKAEQWNKKLDLYKRCTGKIKESSVAKNHILVAHSLGLLRISGHLVESTSYSALFASLPMNEKNPFDLTTYEKLSFFDLLFKERFNALSKIIQLAYGSGRSYFDYNFLRKNNLDDHTVKSHIEWLIDLNIVIPLSKAKKGGFELAKIDHLVKEISTTKSYTESLLKVYAQFLLGKHISEGIVNDEILMESFKKSFEKTKDYCFTEIDKRVFSALPIIYYCRLYLLIEHGIFINLSDLIKNMEKVLPQKKILFRWDPSYGGGYIKYEEH